MILSCCLNDFWYITIYQHVLDKEVTMRQTQHVMIYLNTLIMLCFPRLLIVNAIYTQVRDIFKKKTWIKASSWKAALGKTITVSRVQLGMNDHNVLFFAWTHIKHTHKFNKTLKCFSSLYWSRYLIANEVTPDVSILNVNRSVTTLKALTSEVNNNDHLF